jgi:hypothetical protein
VFVFARRIGKRANKKMSVYSQSLPTFTSIVIARPIAEIAAEPSGVPLTITRQVLGFALQKLRDSLRLIPSMDAVFSKGFL